MRRGKTLKRMMATSNFQTWDFSMFFARFPGDQGEGFTRRAGESDECPPLEGVGGGRLLALVVFRCSMPEWGAVFLVRTTALSCGQSSDPATYQMIQKAGDPGIEG